MPRYTPGEAWQSMWPSWLLRGRLQRQAIRKLRWSFGQVLLDASKHAEVKEKIQQTKEKAREKLETRSMSSVFFAVAQSCERERISGSGCSVAGCAPIVMGLGLWKRCQGRFVNFQSVASASARLSHGPGSEAKISEKKLSETIHMDMPDSDEDDEDVSEQSPAAMAGMHGVAIGSGIEPRWKHDEVFIGKMEKGESIEITTCSEDTTKEQREILQERQLISNPLKACLRSCVDSLNGVVDDSATPKAKPRRPRREQTMLDKLSKIVTILQWVPELTFHKVRADLVAGLTVGVMVIPQSMSYGAIAGLPYINGMYSACVPTLVYALFGQSRQLAVGPVAMVSLLIEAGLNGSLGPECNVPGKAQYEVCTSEYVGLACLAAALVGVMQVAASLLKLGFLVTFLGHPVISGFTSGAAIIIGLSQLKYMLGYDIPKSQYIYDTIINVAMNIQETKPMPLLLGVLWLAYLISNKQIAGRYRRLKMLAPMGPLISCVAGTVLIWAWPDMSEKYHVKYVGEIPSGLFPISIGSWQLDKIPTVVGTAMSACLIGYMESIAIGKNLAATNGYEIEASCMPRKLFFFYDRNFVPLRDQMVASLEQSGGLADFTLCEDVLDDLKGNNRAGGGMPTYLYKSAKIGKALNDVDTDEIFLFTDVDVQYFQPVHDIVRECMADGTDIVFQQEFEDIGVNIGFMAMRKSAACQAFWEFVHAEISRTQALDQRVVNNSLYSGHAAATFGLRWKRWPSSIWASSMAFSSPLPQPLVVHHANFLVEKAPAADPTSKVAQLMQLRQATLGDDKEAQAAWAEFMQGARTCPAMLDYRSRHFGERRPGPEWSTLPENHIARLGGYSERAAKRAAAVVKGAPCDPDAARIA
ncbi:SULTR2 [Symbiodinium sp. CCMP2456]|nr:SULTR2 [Symbiodinium sp. CCMP2456]